MDHSDTGLRAVCKSLVDVIAPAIDPTDPLANEQLGLILHYLQFLRGRLDHLHARHRFELADALAMVHSLREINASFVAETEVTMAQRLLDDPASDTQTLRSATATLAAAASAVVVASTRLDPDQRRAIALVVVNGTENRIAMERAWYVPLGLDPAPDQVGPLEVLLSVPA